MRPLLLTLLFTACLLTTNAQQNNRIHLGFQGGIANGINVFNNNAYVSNWYAGPIGGVYADFCLYKRLWLFSSFNVGSSFNVVKNKAVLANSMDNSNGYFFVPNNLAIAFSINKYDKPWQLYPYVGTSNFVSFGFYRNPLIGFEANREFKEHGNVAFGLNWTFSNISFGTPRFDNQLGFLTIYGKIGFGVWKKK